MDGLELDAQIAAELDAAPVLVLGHDAVRHPSTDDLYNAVMIRRQIFQARRGLHRLPRQFVLSAADKLICALYGVIPSCACLSA